MVNKAD